MPQEFNEIAKAHVDRDDDGKVRGVLHAEQAFLSTARTAQLAAQDYLAKSAQVLEIGDAELHSLGLSPESTPTEDGAEYRLWSEKTQFDTTTVTFAQTCLGL